MVEEERIAIHATAELIAGYKTEQNNFRQLAHVQVANNGTLHTLTNIDSPHDDSFAGILSCLLLQFFGYFDQVIWRRHITFGPRKADKTIFYC